MHTERRRRKLYARLFTFSAFFAVWAVIAALLNIEWRVAWLLICAGCLAVVGLIYLIVEISWRIENN